MMPLVIFALFCAVSAAPGIEDGRWHPNSFGDTGKYIPDDRGKYVHVPNPYIHIDNPYDGGYGPYEHEYDPYLDLASQIYEKIIRHPGSDNPYFKPGYYKNNGIKIIRQNHNYDEDKYDFLFETENKIKQEEKAYIKNPNTAEEGIATSGFYEYIGPDGYRYKTTYTADENGFRPKTERLETPYSGKWEKIRVNGLGDRVY